MALVLGLAGVARTGWRRRYAVAVASLVLGIGVLLVAVVLRQASAPGASACPATSVVRGVLATSVRAPAVDSQPGLLGCSYGARRSTGTLSIVFAAGGGSSARDDPCLFRPAVHGLGDEACTVSDGAGRTPSLVVEERSGGHVSQVQLTTTQSGVTLPQLEHARPPHPGRRAPARMTAGVAWRRWARRRAVACWATLAALGAVAVSACGGGAGSAATTGTVAGASTAPTTGAPPGAVGSPGCGTGAPGGSGTLDIDVGGHRRVVVVHVPTGYSGAVHVPLVLNLHGSGATAVDQEAFTGMDATADTDGFIVAYPQGLIPDDTGFDWNVPGEPLVGGRAVPAGSPDDVTFLTDLVGSLEARYCVDPARVYATGFSGGARMASQLACDASGIFAAVAPVSGLRRPTPCPARRAVPVIAFHGTADPVDPFAGHGAAYWTYSVPSAAARWAAQDGCGATPAGRAGAGFTLTTYAGCRDRAVVELYAVTGEGHEWPGGPLLPRALRLALGPQSDALDAGTLMWAFFAAHPMP